MGKPASYNLFSVKQSGNSRASPSLTAPFEGELRSSPPYGVMRTFAVRPSNRVTGCCHYPAEWPDALESGFLSTVRPPIAAVWRMPTLLISPGAASSIGLHLRRMYPPPPLVQKGVPY
jgi:hypothetical protein